MQNTVQRKLLTSLLIISLALSLDYGQKIKRDVPYVPTPPEVVQEMLKMAEVQKDDILYDLGCGDGRIVITAAKEIGTRGIGVDIDPKRIKESWENAKKAKVEDLVEFRIENLFETDFSQATVITLYLLRSINLELRPKLFATLKPGTRIVSHDFSMHTWKPDKQTQVMANYDYHWIYFWIIPANVSGTWHVQFHRQDGVTRYMMSIDQRFQKFEGNLTRGGLPIPLINTDLQGASISFSMEQIAMNGPITWIFTGNVLDQSMEGEVYAQRGARILRGTWRAQREPGTQKPIDPLKVKEIQSANLSPQPQ